MSNYLDDVKNDYFNWLYDYVCENRVNDDISYKKLFMLLHNTEFTYSIRNDGNRAADGIGLRQRYSAEMNDKNIYNLLNGPCSILEMLVALAIRCEETIMVDPRYGNRTSQWFWIMIKNLGLSLATDDNFNKASATEALNIFIRRKYDYYGRGGLFYIPNPPEDVRKVEIWNQLNWYINSFN